MLSELAKAPDDAALLAALGDIDPLEFRKFLAECDELANPVGMRLLSAVEARYGLLPTNVEFDDPLSKSLIEPAATPIASARVPEDFGRPYVLQRAHRFRYMLATLALAIVVVFFGALLRRSWVSPNLSAALKNLDGEVATMPDLFDAPSPRLQLEFLSRPQNREAERALVLTLYQNRADLPASALSHAALLAFALEDYTHASAFVETGLSNSSADTQLLATRGLIEYAQSLYPQALSSFQQAARRTPESKTGFGAAIIGNEGLARWDLGQTRDAERSLSESITLLDNEEQQVYLLLTQADLYADYGQAEKALEASKRASSLIGTQSFDKRARAYHGHVRRVRAKLAFFRGDTREAKQEIEEAIKIHQDESSILELAQDKALQAEIQLQTGMRKEALEALQEAVQLYKSTEYAKGQSEILLHEVEKLTPKLIDLNQYEEAERLINSATDGFTRINYKKGLGQCEAMRGVLILKLASHKYLEHFDASMSPREKQAASQEFVTQAITSTAQFKTAISTFQAIGYKPGIAYAQDKLAISLIILDQVPSKEILSQAAQYSTEASQIYEEIGNKREQAAAYGNLGIIYRKSKQYDLALSNLERALQIFRDIGFKLGIGRQFLNLGRLYYEKAFSEKSEHYLRKARTYFLKAQKLFRETQAADELKFTDLYLKNLSEILH